MSWKQRKVRPILLIFVVLFFFGVVLVADYTLDGGFSRDEFIRISPDANGVVSLDVADLAPNTVRFYRFLNYGNQEVKFFVGRDESGQIQAAFDANEVCAKLKRGYRHDGEWMTCNKCDRSFKLAEVNEDRGGCAPVALKFRQRGDLLEIDEASVLAGWRYFR